MTMLSPLFQELQMGLFIVSGMLGLGALFGLLVGAGQVAEELSPLASSSGKSEPHDQRHAPRTPCNMLLELLDVTESTSATGSLVNISATGACIISSAILLKDDPITVRLPTMKKGANKLSGRVVWLRSNPGSTLYGIRLNPSTHA